MLDKRLRDVLGEYGREALAAPTKGFPSREKYIAQIKQAFADEGWTHKPFLKHLLQTDDTPVYTGQEWLDRFNDELDGGLKLPDVMDIWVRHCANKASGVDK